MREAPSFTPPWENGLPLYQQLYRYIAGEIRAGRLVHGDRLPSKRALAAHLRLSLSTVEGAYGLLTAEGYVEAWPRSGYRVCAAYPAPVVPPRPEPEVPGADPGVLDPCFSTAAVDATLFPYGAWARLMRRAVGEPELLQRGDPQGDPGLREALCAFLRQYRGVCCRPEQVVVGAGLEYLLGLVHQLLPPELTLALEDPGYRSVWRAAERVGRRTVAVPVDGAGLDPLALEASGAEVACLTPSHQFPLGVTMPAGRRAELLHWAYAAPGRYLIEDDYDSEFRYASRPLPALQGSDGGRRVLYAGTFSRTIAPSIRAAYLILPEALLARYRAGLAHGASTVSRYEQRVLEGFLSTGQYGRHLRRTGVLYRARRDALTSALATAFPQGAISGADAGLHLLLTLPGRTDEELTARAAAAGYAVHGLEKYCHGPSPRPGTLVLGYAGLEETRAAQAVAALRRAFR